MIVDDGNIGATPRIFMCAIERNRSAKKDMIRHVTSGVREVPQASVLTVTDRNK
jgi:hypothetical protein